MSHERVHVASQRSSQPRHPAHTAGATQLSADTIERAQTQPDSLQADEVLQLQQTLGNQAVIRLMRGDGATALPAIQRAIELRPPGRGEASAFERREELVERLNRQSEAIQYHLEDRTLKYTIVDEAALTNFDQRMIAFIDAGPIVPFRLITNEGLISGNRLLIDSVDSAYVDLDDMLASDDLSFQMNIIHFVTERLGIRNYERRIGTSIAQDAAGNTTPEFRRAHAAGIDAETAHLRSVFNDPTIRFVFEEDQGRGRIVFGFRSREGYRIFHIFTRGRQSVQGGHVTVRTTDRRNLTVEAFLAERAAAQAAAPAAAPAAAAP